MRDRRISRAIELLIEGNSIAHTAKQVNLSVSRFRHLFTNITGMSPYQYQKRDRLDKAALRLKSGFESTNCIAKAAGYDRTAGFSKAFRRQFGQSPSEYRKQLISSKL